MAENKTPIEPGGLTRKADASRYRVAEVSNVSRTINEMQKKVDQQIVETSLNVGDFEHIEKVQNSMIKVLSSLSLTVGKIGSGFQKAATAIPVAGKEVISQYSKAISEDISYNKQNIVAMALSRSTPIFGYFASKFMETDIYKSAASKMKANMVEAFSGVTAKFKEGVGGFFKKLKSKTLKEKPIKTIKERVEIIKERTRSKDKTPRGLKEKTVKISKEKASSIPKMQRGGYVEKGGLARLHPAEIVVPIDKILKQIDNSISVTKDLADISRKAQLKTMAKMTTYVEAADRFEKVGLFKGFVKALNTVQLRHTEPANIRMLRAVLAIQDSMGATIGTWPQVWQKMLVEHPTFRNLMFSLKAIKGIVGTPINLIYQVFKSRGGYQAHLSRSKNPMQATAENIGLVYTGGMWRLDNIAKFTRATAEATRDLSSAFTGKKYPKLEGVGIGKWSLMGLTRSMLNLTTKLGIKGIGTLIDAFTPKRLNLRIKERANILAEALTKERKSFLTKLLPISARKKEMAGIYGKGKAVKDEDISPRPITIFPADVYDIIEKTKALPVIDSRAIELFEQNKLDNQNTYDIIEASFKEVKKSNVLLLEAPKDALANQKMWQKQKKSNDKKELGYVKDIVKINDENLDIQKKINLRQKVKNIFGVFQGSFGAIKSILSVFAGFIPFLLGGGLQRILKSLIFGGIKGGIKGGLKSFFSKAMFSKIALLISGGIKGAFKGIFPKGIFGKMLSSISKISPIISKLSTRIGSVFAKVGPVFAKIGPMFAKLGPILSRILPIILKIAGPVAALATAGAVGWKIGKKLDKVLGISEKVQASLDKAEKKTAISAKELDIKRRKIREKAAGGILPSQEGFEAARTVKMQTLIGKNAAARAEDVGFFGRSNLVAINTAQQNYMNDNIANYLKYSYDDIKMLRKKWLERGGYHAKMIMADPVKYGRKREAAFLTFLQKEGTPISETQTTGLYQTYEERWKERHKLRGKAIEVVEEGAAKVKDYTKVAVDTGLSVAEKAMGFIKEKSALADKAVIIAKEGSVLAKEGAQEALAQSKQITSELKKQGIAALDSSKKLAGSVTQGLVSTSNAVSNSISNINTVNNNNNSTQPQFSGYTIAVLRGDTAEVQ